MVYHYTNEDGLIGILGNEPESQYVTFWAFDIKSYEGQDELAFAFRELYPELCKVEEEIKCPSLSRLSRMFSHTRLTTYPTDEVVNANNFIYKPYVISFSQDSNNEKLWEKKMPTSICIHVNEDYLRGEINNIKYWSDDVMYGINNDLVRRKLSAWYDTYLSFFEHTTCINDVCVNECICMSAMKLDIYPFLKLEKYIKEKEFRTVCLALDEKIILHLGNREYCELKIPIKAVECIEFHMDISLEVIKRITTYLKQLRIKFEIENRIIKLL